MAARYWVGGSGNWSDTAKWSTTSGGTGGASVPTSADDAIVDGNSGSPTISLNSSDRNCLTLTTTGSTCTINPGTGTITLNVYGNITLNATTTINSNVILAMRSSGTIAQNGATLTRITFDGAGATFTLGSNISTSSSSTANVTLTAGTLTTSASNYSITTTRVTSNGTSTRALTLNASTITCAAWDMGDGTGLTLSAGTSTITLSNTAATNTFTGGGKTYSTVNFTSPNTTTQQIYGANTFTTLSITNNNTAGAIRKLRLYANQTITGTFTATCNSSTNRLRIRSDIRGTQRTISAASVSLSYVDFEAIVGAGVASWTGTSIGNIGNNSNITFTAATTRYAKAPNSGAGVFTYVSWSATDGGASGASIPLPQDTVFFTSTATAGTYSINDLICTSLNCTGFNQTLDADGASNELLVLGNITFNFSGATTSTLNVTAYGTGSNTITSSITDTVNSLLIDAYTGTYTANGSLNCTSFYMNSGTYDAATYDISPSRFYAETTDTATLNMGSGTWTLNGSITLWSITNPSLSLNKQTSNIVINSTDTAIPFDGAGLSYPKITFAGTTASQTITFSGNNTFDELASTKSVAFTIKFTAGSSTTFNAFTVSGSLGNVVTVTSTSTTRVTLTKQTPWYIGTNSTVSNSSNINLLAGDGIDYLAFSYVNAFPGSSGMMLMF